MTWPGTDKLIRTNGDRMYQAATWSPNGAHLAFKVHPEGKALDSGSAPEKLIIHRHDIDTGRTEPIAESLLTPSYDQLVHWSPDGKSLALTARPTADAPLAIWKVNADGSDLRQTDITDVDAIVGWR